MPGAAKFRIVPLLVIVALMAFSVRLVDFVAGVSSLSGRAFAESPPASGGQGAQPPEAALKDPVAEPKPQEAPQKSGDKDARGDSGAVSPAPGAAVEKEPPASGGAENAEGGPDVRWRDASDEEPEFQEVKKEVFEDLVERRETLDRREKELAAREALLKAAEQELDRKYQELALLRGRIETLLEKQSGEEQARVASLVKIYENMKPKEAARIFDTLDLDVLVSVVSKMSERRLSPILAAMNPERARTVTIMLSEEKSLPSLPQENE